MTLEAMLAYLHIVAIMALIVFLSSQAALCRSEWLNAAAVRRLSRLDLIYLIAATVLLITGLLRIQFGLKGSGWYWQQPLVHAKLGLFLLVGLMSIKPTLAYRRWSRQLNADGSLPSAEEVQGIRRIVMWEAHLLMLFPIAGVMLARGLGVK